MFEIDDLGAARIVDEILRRYTFNGPYKAGLEHASKRLRDSDPYTAISPGWKLVAVKMRDDCDGPCDLSSCERCSPDVAKAEIQQLTRELETARELLVNVQDGPTPFDRIDAFLTSSAKLSADPPQPGRATAATSSAPAGNEFKCDR